MIDSRAMLEVMSVRQSDRRYLDKPVEKEKIDRIAEAGRLSPSACNGQPWKFIVVDDPVMRLKVAGATESTSAEYEHFRSPGSCPDRHCKGEI